MIAVAYVQKVIMDKIVSSELLALLAQISRLARTEESLLDYGGTANVSAQSTC